MSGVAIIMPVRNAEKTLVAAMNSLFYQTHDKIHVVAVDDQSIDNSPEILQEYVGRDGFRLSVLSTNGEERQKFNMANALNNGINFALQFNPEYIARMDADDECHPERIEKQVRFMSSRNLGMTGTWAHVVQGDNVLEDFHPEISTLSEREWLVKFNYFIHGSVMMRTSTLLKTELYSTDHPYIEDYEMWFRFANVSRIGIVPEYLYYLNRGPSSTVGKENMIYNSAKTLRESWAKMWGIKIPDHDLPNYCTKYPPVRGL